MTEDELSNLLLILILPTTAGQANWFFLINNATSASHKQET
jgi:hypothetical protein